VEHPDGRLILPDMDSIEFAFDDAKHGGLPANPVMEVLVPSLRRPELAPAGQHVLSANVMYVPHGLKGGWNRDQKARAAGAADAGAGAPRAGHRSAGAGQ
jgi:phytoene dehydrogenase-like protein